MAGIQDELKLSLPTLSKAVFSQPTDRDTDTKITLSPVMIKGKTLYQAERFRNNQAYHENLSAEAAVALAGELEGKYRQVLLVTDTESRQYCLKAKGGYKKTGSTPAVPKPAGIKSHNREKEYILSEGENIPALVDLGVFSQDLHIVRAKYDKYKQINRFIELVDDEFRRMDKEEITILDFGCGKSYLTFILYYYFAVKRGVKATIIGYDLKTDVVERCNRIAEKYHYENLHFYVADVTRDTLYDKNVDMLVTLHACDTATDYALHYAISRGVKHIFSVPCCQHEINSQIKKGGELDILLRHGIIKERVSALLTDAIRAAVLEDLGYRVDMIEFIDFEHSPKNIMIRAEKGRSMGHTGRDSAKALCEQYGFTQTLLQLCEKENE